MYISSPCWRELRINKKLNSTIKTDGKKKCSQTSQGQFLWPRLRDEQSKASLQRVSANMGKWTKEWFQHLQNIQRHVAFGKVYRIVHLVNFWGRAVRMFGCGPGVALAICSILVICQGSSRWEDWKLLCCIQKMFTHFPAMGSACVRGTAGSNNFRKLAGQKFWWLLPEVAALRRAILFLHAGGATVTSYSLLCIWKEGGPCGKGNWPGVKTD